MLLCSYDYIAAMCAHTLRRRQQMLVNELLDQYLGPALDLTSSSHILGLHNKSQPGGRSDQLVEGCQHFECYIDDIPTS